MGDIEALARALCEADGCDPDNLVAVFDREWGGWRYVAAWKDACKEAKHLHALGYRKMPDGHVVVPRELLAAFTDDEECELDHHGHCQTHGWPYADPECPNNRARAMLNALPAADPQPCEVCGGGGSLPIEGMHFRADCGRCGGTGRACNKGE